ncbi:hypothetical protein ABIA32_003159 [Streptacidiphilus sp. MAP12-20]
MGPQSCWYRCLAVRLWMPAKGDAVIEAADLREWRSHDVIDPDGRKIGTLEAVYVDTSSDEPAMATVQVGLPTRHRLVFVPLDDVIVGPGYVRVNYSRSLVKDCPAIGTDDVLPASGEEAIFKHYGLTYQPGAGGERQLARR